jgi:transcriptional regulator with XRE-family HTH domain
MSDPTRLSRKVSEALESPEYLMEELVLDLTSEFLDRLQATSTSRAELARRIGVKAPRVTRILQGNDNFTLRTLVQMASALDCRLAFTLAPCGAEVRWLHVYKGEAETRAAAAPTTPAGPHARYSHYSPRVGAEYVGDQAKVG